MNGLSINSGTSAFVPVLPHPLQDLAKRRDAQFSTTGSEGPFAIWRASLKLRGFLRRGERSKRIRQVARGEASDPVRDLLRASQPRLFDLAETLGDEGWLRALRLADYTPRRSRRPEMLQQALFAFTDAVEARGSARCPQRTSWTIPATPMTTMNARSATGGKRLPTFAPTWPPAIAPPASSATASHST